MAKKGFSLSRWQNNCVATYRDLSEVNTEELEKQVRENKGTESTNSVIYFMLCLNFSRAEDDKADEQRPE